MQTEAQAYEVAQPSRRTRLRPGHHGSQLVAVAPRVTPTAATDRPARIGAGYLEKRIVSDNLDRLLQLLNASETLGPWMSAALSDPNASGLNTRTVPIPPTQESDPCQSSPN